MGLLDSIVGQKQREVESLRLRATEIHRAASQAASAGAGHAGTGAAATATFADALRAGPCVSVIAEVKRRSPSAGAIRESADPVKTATGYQQGGASAISVLTDAEYFGGSIEDLRAVAANVRVPVLRKDFIIDELQILEARANGASAILLIVRLLDDSRLKDLRETAEEQKMDALVEVHDDDELERAMKSGAKIIGINNRDLDTLTIDLNVSERILPTIPKHIIAIAESGLKSAQDVARMAAAGADAVLVGEALMREMPSHTDTHAGAAEMACVPRVGR